MTIQKYGIRSIQAEDSDLLVIAWPCEDAGGDLRATLDITHNRESYRLTFTVHQLREILAGVEAIAADIHGRKLSRRLAPACRLEIGDGVIFTMVPNTAGEPYRQGARIGIERWATFEHIASVDVFEPINGNYNEMAETLKEAIKQICDLEQARQAPNPSVTMGPT